MESPLLAKAKEKNWELFEQEEEEEKAVVQRIAARMVMLGLEFELGRVRSVMVMPQRRE